MGELKSSILNQKYQAHQKNASFGHLIGPNVTVKPTYEELERRVQELEKIEFERNQGEEIVQDGQSRWLVENANELILVTQDGLIRFVNQKVFDYLGYSPEELKDRPFIKYIYPEDREKVSENNTGLGSIRNSRSGQSPTLPIVQ